MKFRSVTGFDISLALTSGHTAVVTTEGCEIDSRFHKEAIAQGCLPEGVEETSEAGKPSFDRKQVIVDALNAMLAGSDAQDFTKQGKPSLGRLIEKVGFTVDRSEVDAIWEELAKA
jgi:hypothetical protein